MVRKTYTVMNKDVHFIYLEENTRKLLRWNNKSLVNSTVISFVTAEKA